MKKAPELTVVDLFCGAGGLSLGLRQAGFRVLTSIDHDEWAVQTYRRNLGDHVVEADIGLDTRLPEASVIVGGPPCQGFSSAGSRRSGDARNTLVGVYAGLIAERKPTAFVFENVEGFLTGEDGAHVLELLRPLVDAGYRIHMRKVNAANYGVPQHRKRVLAIGGLGWDPSFPAPTHMAFGAPGAHLVARERPKTPTILDGLEGLSEPASGPEGRPQGHYAPPVSAMDLKRIRALLPGQRMRDLPPELQHQSYTRRAFRRVMDGTPTERRGGAPSGIRRLKGDEPSKAITSASRNEFLHPVEDRFLTIRECARLQTFPDDFEFLGPPTAQMLHIGNAVPPALGEVIGRGLAADLKRIKRGFQPKPGALLSFVPTASQGMSPALERTTELVMATFGVRFEPKEQLQLWG
ncbi:DNA cytosine methyltransferase [Hyalangium rubrum]|uniref:Cytosine-specific methyltransferase n=1 Tax=Hyalangium rubrum TaxID=3103134 RepID=A0ABU5H825_9BACT|nr:DNA cytosine methyltransferase [Hyalangium sp. s54d21]MDY7229034.1 DNA cytosine methyltransferase [Hyalangium sp. s54d21]